VRDNLLTGGALPSSLQHAAGLQYLLMSGNAFDDSEFPAWLPAQLPQLRELELRVGPSVNWRDATRERRGGGSLASCGLTGSLPTAWEASTPLLSVRLSGNALSGSIPYQLFLLEQVLELRLDDNLFSGDLADLSSVDHERYIALDVLDLSGNQLRGTLDEFLDGFRWIVHLDVSHNRLHGDLTPYFAVANLSTLDLGPSHPLSLFRLFRFFSVCPCRSSYSLALCLAVCKNKCSVTRVRSHSNTITRLIHPHPASHARPHGHHCKPRHPSFSSSFFCHVACNAIESRTYVPLASSAGAAPLQRRRAALPQAERLHAKRHAGLPHVPRHPDDHRVGRVPRHALRERPGALYHPLPLLGDDNPERQARTSKRRASSTMC